MRDYEEARQEFLAELDNLGITIDAEFVPFSRSRNAKESPKFSDYNLNWQVTVYVRNKKLMVVNYSQGQAYCPSYRQYVKESYEYRQKIMHECEMGMDVYGNPIELNVADVLYCIVTDCLVLDYINFEDWAQAFGYDVDSRKAERIYNECLRNAIALRVAIGDPALRKLQEISSDM